MRRIKMKNLILVLLAMTPFYLLAARKEIPSIKERAESMFRTPSGSKSSTAEPKPKKNKSLGDKAL
jgi:hypothetical protein